jgi:hypothetical protein
VALGLVLGLSVMATPVSADVTTPGVTVTNTDCACASNATYTITFNTTASLTEGVHSICINFPAGTTVPATGAAWENGDITVNATDVFGSEVTVTSTKVCFLVPTDFAAGPLTVVFTDDANIKNPCTAGTYNLYVNTSRAPDSTPVKSADYIIKPAVSTYKFVKDFSVTYPGLAPDFIPPLKACGGQPYDILVGGYNMTGFNLTFMVDIAGCQEACMNATLSMALTAAPTGGTLHISLNGTGPVISLDLSDPPDSSTATIAENVTLATALPLSWDAYIHVDMVGDYTLCFYAICPATQVICGPVGQDLEIAKQCITIKGKQSKDVVAINLTHKWNLISLPLVPFDSTITNILAALPAAVKAQILCIWNFDQCNDAASNKGWSVWGPSCPAGAGAALNTMKDGTSYWIRTVYNSTTGYHMGDSLGTLWVWGTAKPEPPAYPSAYPVCTGWNMVGFTELPPLSPMLASLYLTGVTYGAVEGWDAPTQSWVVNPANMASGLGYWVSVIPATGGTIYPQ